MNPVEVEPWREGIGAMTLDLTKYFVSILEIVKLTKKAKYGVDCVTEGYLEILNRRIIDPLMCIPEFINIYVHELLHWGVDDDYPSWRHTVVDSPQSYDLILKIVEKECEEVMEFLKDECK